MRSLPGRCPVENNGGATVFVDPESKKYGVMVEQQPIGYFSSQAEAYAFANGYDLAARDSAKARAADLAAKMFDKIDRGITPTDAEFKAFREAYGKAGEAR